MRVEPNQLWLNKLILSVLLLLSTEYCFSITSVDTVLVNSILIKADSYIEKFPDKSDSLAGIALNFSEQIQFNKGVAESYLILATNDRIANHNIQAIKNYYKCLNYYVSNNDSIKVQFIYQWLGLCLAFESYYDSGKAFIYKSIEIAKKLNLPNSVAQSYLNLARLDKSQGNLKNAAQDCDLALKAIENTDELELKWKIENFLGYVYILNNKHKEAALIINKNMMGYKKYLNQPVEVYRLIYYNSLLDLFLGNYKKVVLSQKIALSLTDSIPNKNLSSYFKAMSYELIGKSSIKTENFDSALYFLLLASNNPEYNLDLHAMGEVLYNLADAYFYHQEYDSALFFFNKSANLQIENKNPLGLRWSYLGIGKTYYQLKNSATAEKYLIKSIDNDFSEQNIEILAQSAQLLSLIYEDQKKYRLAYEYFKIYKDASDELFNQNKLKQIIQLELENEFEDREQQIQSKNQQERISFEARLKQNKLTRNFIAGGLVMALVLLLFIFKNYNQKKKANHEKEILLKEIHHRVKNNLQIISSMLSLQGSYLSDQKIKDAVTESQGRVKSMALIHQMLYQHDSFSSIDMKEYVSQLVNSISSSFGAEQKNISVVLAIEAINLDIDTAIPMGLILNELLTNAFKYAFAEKNNGLITVGLKRLNQERLELTVEDNGIGIPENIQTTKKSKSLGLNMINILTRQLKGDLKIIVSDGTIFTIQFSELIKH